jgi:hypothetical protein
MPRQNIFYGLLSVHVEETEDGKILILPQVSFKVMEAEGMEDGKILLSPLVVSR